MTQKIKVAAIQMDALFGQREHNLKQAETYIRQAAKQGAQIIVLPELLPYGYGIDESVWDGAEPLNGPSLQWLQDQARTHKAYIGFSLLETDGNDFYNPFVLVNPQGEIAARVRKTPAPSVESYFYKSGDDSHVVDTEFGRIGICICYEMLLHERLNDLYMQDIDLCLIASAGARPKNFIPGDIERLERSCLQVRDAYHQALQVPVILASRVGKLEGQLPSKIMGYLRSTFLGGSFIRDSDGRMLAEMDTQQQQGVIVAEVTLDPQRKAARRAPQSYKNMWAVPMPWYSFLYPMTQPWGDKSYAANARRKQKAKEKYAEHQPG